MSISACYSAPRLCSQPFPPRSQLPALLLQLRPLLCLHHSPGPLLTFSTQPSQKFSPLPLRPLFCLSHSLGLLLTISTQPPQKFSRLPLRPLPCLSRSPLLLVRFLHRSSLPLRLTRRRFPSTTLALSFLVITTSRLSASLLVVSTRPPPVVSLHFDTLLTSNFFRPTTFPRFSFALVP